MPENNQLIDSISPDMFEDIQASIIEYLATNRFVMPEYIDELTRSRALKIAAIEVPKAFEKSRKSRVETPRFTWSGSFSAAS